MNLPAPRLRFREPGLPRLDPGIERYRLAGLGGLVLHLFAGDRVEIVDREGRQACAVAAFGSAQAADPAPVAISIRDHQFVPAEVTVPAGAKVELQIRNEQATAAEFESNQMRREKVIPPGGTVSVYIGPLNPGRYEFFDDFHPATRGAVVAR